MRRLEPRVIFTEITGPNALSGKLEAAGHLSANLLKTELMEFRNIKGYLPRIIVLHVTPHLENEIRGEVKVVSGELKTEVDIAYEGMVIQL